MRTTLFAAATTAAVLAVSAAPALAAPTFEPGEEQAALPFPNAEVELADFDADGHDDALVSGSADVCACGAITIHFGGADGLTARRQALRVPLGTEIADAVAADLNRDGRADVAALTSDPSGSGLLVFLGSRNGFETVTRSLPAAEVLASGDFDRDGRTDLVAGLSQRPALAVLSGIGKGRFRAPTRVDLEARATDLVATDLNADRVSDLAVAGGSGLEVAEGRRRAGLTDATLTAGEGSEAIAAGDLDDDGDLDLALSGADVTSFLNDGDADFARASRLSTGLEQPAEDLELVDLDADGAADLLLPAPDGLRSYAGLGDGSFGGDSALAGTESSTALGVTDFDSDGRSDLAVLREPQDGPNVPSRLASLRNAG